MADYAKKLKPGDILLLTYAGHGGEIPNDKGGGFDNERNDILCCYSCSISKLNIEKNISIGLYRIYQEALTNIARHSGADVVTSSLEKEGDNLVLTVADNGRGFDPLDVKSKKTLGLLGMKERALIMKGELMIQSKPGAGTAITITIPLPAPMPELQVMTPQEIS